MRLLKSNRSPGQIGKVAQPSKSSPTLYPAAAPPWPAVLDLCGEPRYDRNTPGYLYYIESIVLRHRHCRCIIQHKCSTASSLMSSLTAFLYLPPPLIAPSFALQLRSIQTTASSASGSERPVHARLTAPPSPLAKLEKRSRTNLSLV